MVKLRDRRHSKPSFAKSKQKTQQNMAKYSKIQRVTRCAHKQTKKLIA